MLARYEDNFDSVLSVNEYHNQVLTIANTVADYFDQAANDKCSGVNNMPDALKYIHTAADAIRLLSDAYADAIGTAQQLAAECDALRMVLICQKSRFTKAKTCTDILEF